MRFPLKDPMLLMVRVEGKGGTVRELSAALDINHPYCGILTQDAIDLGYSQAANRHSDEERVAPERVPRLSSHRGLERGILVPLNKVSIGNLVARNVDAVVLEMEIPRLFTVDMTLVRSFV